VLQQLAAVVHYNVKVPAPSLAVVKDDHRKHEFAERWVLVHGVRLDRRRLDFVSIIPPSESTRDLNCRSESGCLRPCSLAMAPCFVMSMAVRLAAESSSVALGCWNGT
jgi:hypothetical protein